MSTRTLAYVECGANESPVINLLRSNGWRVERTRTVERELADGRLSKYNTIVLDWELLDERSAVGLCAFVRRHAPGAGILVLSGPAASELKVEMLAAGADDCLSKDMASPEINARIEAVHRRLSLSLQRSFHSGGDSLVVDLLRAEVHVNGQRVHLTMAQWTILARMVERPGAVVGRDALRAAAGLRQDPDGVRLRAIVHDLRARLGRAGTLVRCRRGVGYQICGHRAGAFGQETAASLSTDRAEEGRRSRAGRSS